MKALTVTTVVVCCLFFPFPALAQSVTTNDGHVACLSREWYEDAVSFSVAKDHASFDAYVKAQKCLVLRGGLSGTIVESDGILSPVLTVVVKGVRVWVGRDAVSLK